MLANEPLRRFQSALGEIVPAQRAMGEFNALTQPHKEHGMLTHDIAAAKGVHSDFALCPLTDVAFAPMTNTSVILELARARDNLSQPPGRTAWRVFLQTMVQLENFDVKVRPQHPIGFLGQPE